MAQVFNNAVLTDAGAALLARSQVEEFPVKFTRVATGNGIHQNKSIDALKQRTSLIAQKQTFPLSSMSMYSDTQVKVTSVLSNQGLTTGYYMNEIALFAQAGDDSTTEVMYSIAVAGTDNSNLFPAYNGYSPLEIIQSFVVTTSNTANVEIVMSSDAYALASDLADHEEEIVMSETGAHGIRFHSDTLEVYDPTQEEWKEIETGGTGGSTVLIKTADSSLFSGTVTLSDGTNTITGNMSAAGEAEFVGVTMIGNITVTATKGATSATDTINIPYYGQYKKEITTGTMYKIHISTEEPTLICKTVTATFGVNERSSVINIAGAATIEIPNYTGAVTITATDGTETATDTITITSGTTEYVSTLYFSKVWGVEWDGTSTTKFSRTDAAESFVDPSPALNGGTGSSPFDNLSPWKDMTVEDDAVAGKVVKLKRYYSKWTVSGKKLKLQISNKSRTGFYTDPMHADRGDGHGERDITYIGRYHCSSNYKSERGVKPVASITRAAARTAIHNLRSNIWQYDYAAFWTIWMLYLVEYGDWNSQAVLGYGCGNNSATENMGYTDSMQYHTGTMLASRTTYGVGIQYRNIEGPWDNVLDWCDGIYFSGADVYCIKNPANFSDTTGGTKVGTRPTSSNYISAWNVPSVAGFEYALYPSEVAGSDSTYICDYCYYAAAGVVLCVGGGYGQHQNRGAFRLGGDGAASYTDAGIGSRLQVLP